MFQFHLKMVNPLVVDQQLPQTIGDVRSLPWLISVLTVEPWERSSGKHSHFTKEG
jgi:hypothetical protein